MTKRLLVSVVALLLLVLPTVGPTNPTAQAQTTDSRLVIYGQSGEYISGGQDLTFSESDGATLTATDNGVVAVQITVPTADGFDDRWSLEFVAPGRVPLQSGQKFLATRFPFQEDDVAGMSLSGAGRGCNELFGEFEVREITTTGTTVDSLAVDFRQSCDNGPWLVGGIRINSLIEDPSPDFRVSPAPTGTSGLVLYGRTGDWITLGNDVAVDAGAGVRFRLSDNFDNGISVSITSDGTSAEEGWWDLDFAAPGAAPLAAGDQFTNATRFPFQEPDEAGLDVSGPGRGCNMSTGSFEVYEISINAIGRINQFAADFVQSCDAGPAITGGIRYNSELPLPNPVGDVNCDGELSSADALAVLEYGIGSRQASDGCQVLDPGQQLNVAAGDINDDGVTGLVDALLIAQCSIGVSTSHC